MTAKLLKGTEVKDQILEKIRIEVKGIKEEYGVVPGLVTILVGDNPSSVSYVKAKLKAAKKVGFKRKLEKRTENFSEGALLAIVERYNNNDAYHGILVQLPLPAHIDEKKVINVIDPDKDVDGFHPVNLGRLVLGGSSVKFRPCTPAGILELIIRTGIETNGAEVVVVGRSNIVGKPMAIMMWEKALGANATVTVTHTGTRDLATHCQRADILIVAAGSPGLVKPEWIKPGACIIDVGVNKIGEKWSEKKGRIVAILRGDVDFEAAKEIAGWITPVPGGVGPLTIAMLMKNTLQSLKYKLGVTS